MNQIFAIGLFLAMAGMRLTAASESTNKLAIHLAADGVSQSSIINGTARPEGIRLLPEPIISDGDLLAYNTNDHTFVLTRQAADRVNEVCKHRLQVPFVLLAGNERVYLGVFTSPYSSISADVPSITLWLSGTNTNTARREFKLERGYPAPSATAPKPDPLVLRVLAELFSAKRE